MKNPGARRHRPLVRGLMAVLVSSAAMVMALSSGHAVAAPDHTALVVIDYGDHVDQHTIHFSSDSITGKQALDLTGESIVYQAFGSNGDAVCKIDAVGCEVSQGCLTCGGDHYWAYSHADSGQAVLTPSSKGVSSSTVRDGDEEGWKWGRGEPPTYVRPPPGSASTTTTGPAGSPPSSAPTTTAPSGGSTTSKPAPAARAAGSTPTAGASTTTAPAAGTADPGGSTFTRADDGGPRQPATESASPATRPAAARRQKGSVPGLLVFAVLVAGIVGVGVWARRRRPPTSSA